ncbi:MAG: aminoacetone oxidase family FAD-binding enzyme [Oceanospirillaceae bacterium]|nr:aminoacetone oxidase family FAD-binding enzyme [Oceanospirillaceae bacterium]
MTQSVDVLIIGAGAAGLFCAAQAGQRGHSVIVLDHANKAGKKILMSGGGRCNFTNYYIEPQRYLSANPHFCKSALSRYTQWDFIALVDAYAIPYHEKKDGQLFCDNKASDILSMLLSECEKSGAEVCLDTAVERIEKTAAGFRLETSRGPLTCASLVIATGGPSIPTLGATGFGYDIARQFGLDVLPVRAALVPFTITDQNKALCSALSGTSMPVTVECNNKSFSDDLLFTHRGLSGPAMLQISSYWQPGDSLLIDLLPGRDIAGDLRAAQQHKPKTHLRNWLADVTTQKFAELWLDQEALQLPASRPLAEVSGKQIQLLAGSLHRWQVKPSGTEGYRTAEVAIGGVNTDELSSKTMEAKKVPGLYFIGEVVDVTGHLGGFNFQWAWSSAYAVAEAL